MLQLYPRSNDGASPDEYDYQYGAYGEPFKKRSSMERIPEKKNILLNRNRLMKSHLKFGKRRNNYQNKQQEKDALKYFPILFA